jgi:DnaJ domain
MKIQDAANILDLSDNVTPEDIKLAYRRACMKFHPDRNPAGLQMMQAINAAYVALENFTGTVETGNGYADFLSAAINAVIACPGLVIEVVGNWVWVSGDTKPHKEILKAAGFRWASKKAMWNFRPDEWRSYNRQENSIDEIRALYGSQQIPTKPVLTLYA